MESTLRYRVEYRYRKAPPAPYKNPWRLSWSFDNEEAALEALRDDNEENPAFEYRLVDSHAEAA